MSSLRYLLDTNILIEALRRPTLGLQKRFNQNAPSLATSTVVTHELCFGAARSHDPIGLRNQVDGLTSLLQVLDFDADAAMHAGDIRAALATLGTPIGPYDALTP